MKLIVLGSGTCVPSILRNAPGYYLEIEGRHALVDLGSGTLRQLERAGRSYKEIEDVFITHTHPDHIADLLPFIHALLATPLFTREKDLRIIGPAGIDDFFGQRIRPLLRDPGSFTIEVMEMGERLDLGYIRVNSAKTVHSSNSIAYRFERRDSSIVITGDCDYDEGIVELSKNADLLVIDCSYPDALKAAGHLTPRECGLVAKRAGVKKLILSHIYPTDYPDDVRLSECRAVFDGHVALAEDLMEIDV